MGLKDQLEAAGYDTSGINEKDLIAKLDAAGYDTSSLAPQSAQQPPKPSPLDIAKKVGKGMWDTSVPGMVTNGANYVNQKLNQGGDAIATSQFGQNNPNTAAVLGTAVAKGPQLAGIAMDLAPSNVSATAEGIKSLKDLAQMAFSTQKAGEAMNAVEGPAGVTLQAPVTKEIAKAIGLPEGQQSFNQVTNAIVKKLNNGEEIPLQAAKDYISKTETVLKKPIGRTEKAAISQAVAKVRDFMNSKIPGRTEAASQFATAAKNSSTVDKLASMAKKAAIGYGGYQIGKKMLGH